MIFDEDNVYDKDFEIMTDIIEHDIVAFRPFLEEPSHCVLKGSTFQQPSCTMWCFELSISRLSRNC